MESKDQIVLFVIVASLVGLTFGVFIILYLLSHQRKMHQNALHILQLKESQQKELFQAVNLAEIKEKERIAANLHDEINMNLHLIKLNYERQKRILKKDSEEYTINIENSKLLQKTMQGLTASIFELVPKYMLQFGLSSSLAHDMQQVQSAKNFPAKYSNPTEFEFEKHFNKNQLLNINRLVHEIINNILKHSGCSSLNLEIKPNKESVALNFLHNGKQMSTQKIDELTANSTGLGLKSLKARTLLLNGVMEYITTPDGESLVSLTLPLSPATIQTNP